MIPVFMVLWFDGYCTARSWALALLHLTIV